jgi:hypothetical protein
VVVLFVWIGAVVLAAVVLVFCAYELRWKSQRLTRDLATLTGLQGELTAVSAQLAGVRRRLDEAAR